MDIKETKELLAAAKILLVDLAKIMKDKKINAIDLPVLLDIVKNYQSYIDGLKGIEIVPAELKELSGEEIAEIIIILRSIGLDVYSAAKELNYFSPA